MPAITRLPVLSVAIEKLCCIGKLKEALNMLHETMIDDYTSPQQLYLWNLISFLKYVFNKTGQTSLTLSLKQQLELSIFFFIRNNKKKNNNQIL